MAIAVVEISGNGGAYLVEALRTEGLSTVRASNVQEAGASETALILVGAPPGDPLAFIAELRARRPATLQMVVTDQDDLGFRLAAYAAGADDCLSKPFHLRELAAKLRALRRRGLASSAIRLHADSEAVVDLIALELRFAGRTKNLTKREADLLALLARAGGGAVRREDVLRDAWDAAPGLTGNLVDVYVGYVRRKMDQLGAGLSIKSVRGEGFRLTGS